MIFFPPFPALQPSAEEADCRDPGDVAVDPEPTSLPQESLEESMRTLQLALENRSTLSAFEVSARSNAGSERLFGRNERQNTFLNFSGRSLSCEATQSLAHAQFPRRRTGRRSGHFRPSIALRSLLKPIALTYFLGSFRSTTHLGYVFACVCSTLVLFLFAEAGQEEARRADGSCQSPRKRSKESVQRRPAL